MPDQTIPKKEISSAEKVLDLRPKVEPNPAEVPPHIELAPLPEKLEAVSAGSEDLDRRINTAREHNIQVPAGDIISTANLQAVRELRTRDIEAVLEQGLANLYQAMDPATKQRFRVGGEQASRAINDLFEKGKANLKRIADIIRAWLTIIPGVNRFFLEQEAKIKADKIINLQNKYG
jgi:hypothetical protein